MENEGGERQIKSENSKGGLETEPDFLRPRAKLVLQAPLGFFSPQDNLCLCQDLSHYAAAQLLYFLCSVTLSTAELPCTAPACKGSAPIMVIQPLAGSKPDMPILKAQPSTCPCRYARHVLIQGKIGLSRTNRGKGKVYNGT